MECGKAQSGVRKVKKKQVKDDLDRIKQAEKKKRRLEKALAASAAIISELEKKNQKKKEEQQRLDEECAAIAESVALHVLIGEESDQSFFVSEPYPGSNFDLFVSHGYAKTTANVIPYGYPNGDMGMGLGMGYVTHGCEGSGYEWNGYGSGGGRYGVERDWEAAEAISALRIADDGVDAFVFNRMLRG